MRICRLPLVLILLLLLSACEESVSPILESDRRFTLYGTLDMARDTQFVRVTPIRPLIDTGPPDALDITFTSRDLDLNEVRTWRDSIIVFSDGSFGHVFYSPLRINPGHRYRIEVREAGSDVVTFAETNVPERPYPLVLPEEVSFSVSGGVFTLIGTQRVLWQDLPRRPYRVELWYRFLPNPRLAFDDILLPYEPSYASSGEETSEWRVDLNLARDRRTLDSLVNVRGVPLAGLGLQVILLDEAFEPPGGVFDPEVLAEPGAFTNVENGFGFIGSVGRFSVEWVLTPRSHELLGYVPPGR